MVFVAWRLLAPSAGPPKVLVISVTATVLLMAGVLLVLWYQDAEPPDTLYVPAQLENGRVIPERHERPAPRSAEQIVPEQARGVPPVQAPPAVPIQK
jgi:hypothetical protein